VVGAGIAIGPSSQLPINDGEMDFLWVSVSFLSMGLSRAYGIGNWEEGPIYAVLQWWVLV
jgi:hypothetical protein